MLKKSQGGFQKLSILYRVGHSFMSYVYEPAIALPIMTEWLQNQPNVKLIQKKLRNLDELVHDGYDFVINCTGVGARFLVNDVNIRPISGHVLRKLLYLNPIRTDLFRLPLGLHPPSPDRVKVIKVWAAARS